MKWKRIPPFRESTRTPMIKLKTPTVPVFLIALAMLVLALIGYFAAVPVITQHQFWLAVGGYVLLALGSIL
jgi:hypothetical protein